MNEEQKDFLATGAFLLFLVLILTVFFKCCPRYPLTVDEEESVQGHPFRPGLPR